MPKIKLTPLIEEYIDSCKNMNQSILKKAEIYKQSKLDWKELFSLLANFSSCPVLVICLENNEILFKNQFLEPFFGIETDKKLDHISSSLFVKPSSWTHLVTKLQTRNTLTNYAIEFQKITGDTVAANICAQAVNYEDKLAGLFIFMEATKQPEKSLMDTLHVADVQQLQDNNENQYLQSKLENTISTEKDCWECQQLEARLHVMERAIAASSNGIILTDATQPDNPIIYANPAFEKMTGYSVDEVIGHNCRFLQGNDRDQAAIDELRAAIKEQRECYVVLQNNRKDGEPFWNELYVAPVFDNYGYLTHFIGVQTDITQRIKALEALREREEQYRRIVETATEGIWVINQDNQTTFVNQQMANMLGYTIDEMLGEELFFFMDSEGRAIAQECLSYRQGIHETHDFKFRCKDGSDLWAIISCAPLRDKQGNYAGALGMVTNITDRKQAEAALRESKQRLDGILHSLEDVIWSIAADTFETLYINPTVLKVYGRPESDFVDNPNLWFEVIHPEDQQRVSAATQALFFKGKQELEYRIIRPDGQVRWLFNRSHVIYDANGKPLRIEGIATDITDRKRMEEKLVHHAFYDALTGLPNRVLFMQRLEEALTKIKSQPDQLFAVLFLDLDRFKVVNDSLGHLLGDQLLVAIAQRLQDCLHPDDTVARLGGDEFTILLSHIQSIDDATRIAEQIHQVLKSPFNLSGYEVFTTASIGITLGTTGYSQPVDLLRDADTALYRAKEQGKAWHIVFDSSMYDRAVARLQLETDLRWAIERQELRVYYQPIVSVATGKITGLEALVRWQHPERGLISPAEFIPVAEETGLIVAIGDWVLRESCQQLRQWQLQFPTIQPLTINVNLSCKQFSQPYLVESIKQILQETNLSPSSLKLEITESAIMVSPEQAAIVLEQLKAFGVQLCIDDFGTGYSSLAYLHNFPIDVLKIDRFFINRIDKDNEQLAIVRTIITLAANLGISVVAEGVETINQLVQLKFLQCDEAQGYFFSKALNRQESTLLLEFLAKNGIFQQIFEIN